MNLYEVTLHGTDSIYLLASTKHRAQKLAGELITWRTNLANAKGRLYWQLGNHGGDRHGTALGFSFPEIRAGNEVLPILRNQRGCYPERQDHLCFAVQPTQPCRSILQVAFACPKGFTAPNRYPRIVIGRSAFLVLIPRVDEDGNAFDGTGSSAFRPE